MDANAIIELRRSECSILPLVLKRRWFDMIKSGEKQEEYRDMTDYWAKRLFNWDRKPGTHVVEFRLGYASNAPRVAFHCPRLITHGGLRSYCIVNDCVHSQWGEPRHPHYLIQLGKPVTSI